MHPNQAVYPEGGDSQALRTTCHWAWICHCWHIGSGGSMAELHYFSDNSNWMVNKMVPSRFVYPRHCIVLVISSPA